MKVKDQSTLYILIVTPAPGSLVILSEAFDAPAGTRISWESSGKAALKAVATQRYDLVIVDEKIRDMSPHRLLGRLLMLDAMVNTAVVSNRPAEEFHDFYEGLGVLAQLPPQPGRAEADMLLQKLDNLTPFVA